MNRMLKAKDVSEILQIGETKAYQIIRQLNDELAKKGYLTVRGRISEAYFQKRVFGAEHERGEAHD